MWLRSLHFVLDCSSVCAFTLFSLLTCFFTFLLPSLPHSDELTVCYMNLLSPELILSWYLVTAIGGKVRHHLFCLYLGYIWNETITREINAALHLWVITPLSLVNFERNHWLIPLSPCLFVGVTIIPHRKNSKKKQNWGVSTVAVLWEQRYLWLLQAQLLRLCCGIYWLPMGSSYGSRNRVRNQWGHFMLERSSQEQLRVQHGRSRSKEGGV